MDQKTQALRAFITQSLSEFGYEPDETVFKAIEQTVTLSEHPVSEYEETRSATIKEGSDGKITAEYFSFYNLSRVSLYDLFGLLMDEIAILTMADDPKLKIALSIGKMIHSFYPKVIYKMNETDAKIMLAVYQIKDKKFSPEMLAESYLQQFKKPIEPDQLQRSLDFMTALRFLKKQNDLYSTEHTMNYERE